MNKIMFVATILYLLLLRCSSAQLQGMMCLNCNDVSSPKHCQETAVCGQGEICSVHEFIDHNGLVGYRLGCEDHRVCTLFQQIKSLIGKRDINDDHPAPPDRCYECCATDECNKDLCQQYSGNSYHGVTTQPNASTITPQGVSCMSCQGVESPEHCRQNTVCGENEICFTREYTDHQGLQGFRLGCESKERCSLFLNAVSLFGKRELSDPASPPGCYDCCSSDACNTGLCMGSSYETVTHSATKSTMITTQTTTRSMQPTTTTVKGCLPSNIYFNHSCYFFSTWEAKWTDARSYCRNHSGDLVSINTKDEQMFLLHQMNITGSRIYSEVWTGGVYSQSLHKWEWVDGSVAVYSNWQPSYPMSTSPGYDWHMYMLSPTRSSNVYYQEGRWHAGTNQPRYFICERRKI